MKPDEIQQANKVQDYLGTSPIEDGSVQQCSEQYCGKKATCFTRVKRGLHTLFVPLCEEHEQQICHVVNNLPDLEEKNPEAECVLIRDGHGYQWLVLECPYCGLRHWHFGGIVGKDDPRKELGQQWPKCDDLFRRVVDKHGRYCLVEANKGAEPIPMVSDGCCSNCGKTVYVPEDHENVPLS